MKLPVQVIFRNMDPSKALEEKALTQAKKLERYFDNIIACRVAIEANHRHHNKGKLYHVRIDLTLPNMELVASRNPAEHHAHEDVYVALRDAFIAIRRQLQAHVNKRRGHIKHHDLLPTGRILEVCPPADYGYIGTTDGRELRFTSESVINYDFDKLEVGALVRFVEAKKFAESVASTVRVESNYH